MKAKNHMTKLIKLSSKLIKLSSPSWRTIEGSQIRLHYINKNSDMLQEYSDEN